MPADYCGKAVMELALLALQQSDGGLVRYYHIENPTTTPWSTIASLFIQVCSTEMERVDTKAWLMAVEERANRNRDREEAKTTKAGAEEDGGRHEVPAAVLLAFYSSYSELDSRMRLSTEKAVRVSKAIEYGPVTRELMRRYVSWI